MKPKLSLLIGCLVILASCGGKQKLTYKMTFRSPDSSKTMNLVRGSENMMIRRLAAAKVPDSIVKAVPTGSGSGQLDLELVDSEAADIAKQILNEPFTFDIRLEQPSTSNKSQDSSGNLDAKDWLSTGINGNDLSWIEPITNSTSEAGVELIFTTAGRAKLEKLFKENAGRNIGLFVRDLLVSKLKISGKKLTEHIIIRGIPSAKVAEIFADDVNVGLHVTFTPAN